MAKIERPLPITSAQNSKIKLVHRLRRKRGRQAEDRFVIDYERDLRRALKGGYEIDFLLHRPEAAAAFIYGDIEAHEISPSLLARVSYRETPDSIVAVMRAKPKKGLGELARATIGQAIVLVQPAVPGNIGALLRTADAATMDAVILVDSALDLYNPNIIRNSAGACFGDKIYQLNSDETLAFLERDGFQLVAADAAGARALYDLDFRAKTAIALGAEDRGLPQRWLDAAKEIARIPMNGALSDSLNVSVSGALFMYEMLRQRRRL